MDPLQFLRVFTSPGTTTTAAIPPTATRPSPSTGSVENTAFHLGDLYIGAAFHPLQQLKNIKDAWTSAKTTGDAVKHSAIAAVNPALVQGLGDLWGEAEKIGIPGVKDSITPYPPGLNPEVDPGKLVRGQFPNTAQIDNLKAAGYKSIVNLCAESDADAAEAKAQGLNYLRLPIIDNMAPTRAQVDRFIDFATKPENQPCYVHCEQGVGRTGVMSACYELKVMGKSLDSVLANAKSFGMAMPDQIQFIKDYAASIGAK